jgi:hypothetical protein
MGSFDQLQDEITPHVKPSDCYETKVMGWWEQMVIGWGRGRWMDR